jgi:hypothetical protein
MKVFVSVDLDNRHREDLEALTARIKGAIVNFNHDTHADASVRHIGLGADDIFDRSRRDVLRSIPRT